MQPRNQFFKSIFNAHQINGQQTEFQNTFDPQEMDQQTYQNQILWGVKTAALTINWSQLTNIPQYFIYNGLSKQFILSSDFQDSEISPTKLYASAANKILISNASNNYTETNLSAIFPTYFCYNGLSKQYILSSDFQDSEISPTKLYASAANKILISNASNNYTETNLSAIFPTYFCYSGGSKQYILDSDVQTNEISVSKIKSQNLYYLVGVQTVGSGMSEILMNKANVDNIFQSASIQSSKNIFVNNYKLLGNVTGTNQAGQEITLTRTNNNLLFDNNSIEITKIYSSDTPSSYSIFAVDNNVKEWGDDSTLTKTFWDNIFATNVIDTQKIQNASGDLYFLGRYNSSQPNYFRIDNSTRADTLFSDFVIPNNKLLYPNSLFIDSGTNFNQSLTFFKQSSTLYRLLWSMVLSGYDVEGSVDLELYFSNAYYSININAKCHSSFNIYLCKFYDAGNLESLVDWSGNYINLSDEKRKKNITKSTITDQCAKCYDQLEFYDYDMEKDETDNQSQFGIIAQKCIDLPYFKKCFQNLRRNKDDKDETLYVDKTQLLMRICAVQKKKSKTQSKSLILCRTKFLFQSRDFLLLNRNDLLVNFFQFLQNLIPHFGFFAKFLHDSKNHICSFVFR